MKSASCFILHVGQMHEVLVWKI